MAVNNKPIFGGSPSSNIVNLATANTGNALVASPADGADFRILFTAGTNGGFIDEIRAQWIGTGTPSAAVLNFWITDAAGANARVFNSNTLTAGSAITATNAGINFSYTFANLNLEAGEQLWVSVTAIASNTTLNVTSFGGQFAAQA